MDSSDAMDVDENVNENVNEHVDGHADMNVDENVDEDMDLEHPSHVLSQAKRRRSTADPSLSRDPMDDDTSVDANQNVGLEHSTQIKRRRLHQQLPLPNNLSRPDRNSVTQLPVEAIVESDDDDDYLPPSPGDPDRPTEDNESIPLDNFLREMDAERSQAMERSMKLKEYWAHIREERWKSADAVAVESPRDRLQLTIGAFFILFFFCFLDLRIYR